ncbi:uncharacterized protein LOC122716308 [Apis laboriosa]|uniref:uncharacterized protein LOC122716308 n=1 Tax=Apis laboriosa TaxID=183418 RepID=UPI001CC7C484|nr:uncharacterized protein LOC122716308 [Apis laboriosa]XP_043795178.1 uncharacterized protein LOC122716308 [Apis laboriosa]XP_043795179.1 uncharacterized protein LOC122716308 [Apis laboriosa]
MYAKYLLVIIAIIGNTVSEVPSYIQICGQKNPNFDDCVIKSIENLNKKLVEGIPEINLLPIEPFLLDDITIIDLPNFKIVGTNVKLYQLSTFRIEYLHMDLEKMELDINFYFDKNEINVDYNMTMNILVPIQKNGQLTLKGENIKSKAKLFLEKIERDGKQYLYFKSINPNLNIGSLSFEFDSDVFDFLKETLSKIDNEEILEIFTPNIEKVISKNSLELCNNFCKHFTFDELLPDRE